MATLSTVYGEEVNHSDPFPEHPNPYFARKDYLSLNGEWDFCLNSDLDVADYNKKITIPFAIETQLSGIKEKLSKENFLHYRRTVLIPDAFKGKALRLCFTFVDQVAKVYWNGIFLGEHRGGYRSFSFVIDSFRKENTLELIVTDDAESPIYPRGKQSPNPHGIWYTPTSGIYGPVYLEAIPKDGHIESLKVTPNLAKANFEVSCRLVGPKGEASLSLYYDGLLISQKDFPKKEEEEKIGISAIDKKGRYHVYDLEHPDLYELVLTYNGDEVRTSCALRKFGIATTKDGKAVSLNGKPIYVSAVLDQGYWPESGLTPPNIKAMEADIDFVKSLGFNCIRKHIKFEIPYFYYLCDKKGILVAQDFVNGGSKYNPLLIVIAPFIHLPINDKLHKVLGRGDKEGRDFFYDEIPGTLEMLHNSASLFMYTIFNEGWGQFDSREITEYVREIDPSRLYDSASGWFDQGAGDFRSRHIYFRRARLLKNHRRILSLSEFGGYSHKVKGHTYSEKTFGYKKFSTLGKLQKGFDDLFLKDLLPNIEKKGLAMSVLTQLSDVEEEINGLITYDRKVVKCDPARMKELHEIIYKAFGEKAGS